MIDHLHAAWPGGADELGELLSALLDGELEGAQDAEVRAFVDSSDEAQAELVSLAMVRTAVRDLPAVDPPFGFYEKMLLAERRSRAPRATAARRPMWPRVAGAVAVAAAAVVLIVGITPATDSVVPPVTAFAARHEQMATPSTGSTPTPPGPPMTSSPMTAAPTTAAPTTSAVPPTTAAPTTSAVPPTTAPTTVVPTTASAPTATSAAGMAFEAMPTDALDAMGAPVAMSHDMKRVAGYHTPDGVVHLMYTNGTVTLSIFEQLGSVAWDRLPAAGHTMQLGNDPAWAMDMHGEEIVVVARGAMVYTVVMTAPRDLTMAMATELPSAPEPSIIDRAQSGCRSVVGRFSLTA